MNRRRKTHAKRLQIECIIAKQYRVMANYNLRGGFEAVLSIQDKARTPGISLYPGPNNGIGIFIPFQGIRNLVIGKTTVTFECEDIRESVLLTITLGSPVAKQHLCRVLQAHSDQYQARTAYVESASPPSSTSALQRVSTFVQPVDSTEASTSGLNSMQSLNNSARSSGTSFSASLTPLYPPSSRSSNQSPLPPLPSPILRIVLLYYMISSSRRAYFSALSPPPNLSAHSPVSAPSSRSPLPGALTSPPQLPSPVPLFGPPAASLSLLSCTFLVACLVILLASHNRGSSTNYLSKITYRMILL